MVLPEIIELRDDATMVLYTDGITDIVNRSGENFEDAILCDFVENHHQLDVKEFNESLLNRIDEFNQEQLFPDDIAVLTCKILLWSSIISVS